MISTPYSADPVLTTSIFAAVGGITVIVGIPSIVLLWKRRDIQPLRVRRIGLLLQSQVSHFFHFI